MVSGKLLRKLNFRHRKLESYLLVFHFEKLFSWYCFELCYFFVEKAICPVNYISWGVIMWVTWIVNKDRWSKVLKNLWLWNHNQYLILSFSCEQVIKENNAMRHFKVLHEKVQPVGNLAPLNLVFIFSVCVELMKMHCKK